MTARCATIIELREQLPDSPGLNLALFLSGVPLKCTGTDLGKAPEASSTGEAQMQLTRYRGNYGII
jgi:hypothetical protein